MRHRKRPQHHLAWLLLAIFVAGALLQLHVARETRLSWLSLDRELRVLPESPLPPGAPVRAGDRLVSVDSIDVRTLPGLAIVLDSLRGQDTVRVQIQRSAQRTRMTLEAALAQLNEDEEATAHVIRAGPLELDRSVGAEELAAITEDLDAQSPVEILHPAVSEEGRWPLARSAPSLLDLAGLLILLGLLLALFLQRTGALQAATRRAWLAPAACLFGGLALLALAALWLRTLPSPLWLAWAIALCTIWRALEFLNGVVLRSGEASFSMRLAALLPPSALAAITLYGLLGMPGGWLSEEASPASAGLPLLGLSLLWVLHLVDAALSLRAKAARAGRTRLVALLLCLLLLGLATLLYADLLPKAHPDEFPLALLASVAPLWLVSLLGPFDASTVGRGGRGVGTLDACIGDLLQQTSALLPERSVWIAVGNGESFRGLRLLPTNLPEERNLQVRRLPEAWEGAIAMLHAEGGILPRADRNDPDDPLFGVAERTGIAVAFPLLSAGHGVVAYLFAHEEEEGLPEAPLEALLARCADVPEDALRAELHWLALNEREAGRAAPSVDAPSSQAGERDQEQVAERDPSPSVPAAMAAGPRQELWSEAMVRQLESLHPIDDPAAISEGEWRALRAYASAPTPLLISGEPGVGKEFVARAIAREQFGPAAPVVVHDFTRTPPAVIEAELLGEAGEPGLLAILSEGALILKGASTLAQERLEELLRALDGASLRVFLCERYTGPEEELEENLPAALLEWVGKARLPLTPLRERPEDLLRFADYYLQRFAMRYDRMVTGLSEQAEAVLRREELPANFHDVQHLMRGALLRGEGERVAPQDLHLPEAAPGPDALTPEERREREACLEALETADGNKSEAARLLGMSRGSLLRRLKKFGIEDGS